MFNYFLVTLLAVQINCQSSASILPTPSSTSSNAVVVTTVPAVTVTDNYVATTTTVPARGGVTVTDNYAATTTTKNSVPTLADCLTSDTKKAAPTECPDDVKTILSSATSDYMAMHVLAIMFAMVL
jgi:hypothetical protein